MFQFLLLPSWLGLYILPTNGEAHCRVDIARAVLWYRTWKRQPGRHLTETLHHGENGNASKGVAEQDREGAGMNECLADSQEETSSNCA